MDRKRLVFGTGLSSSKDYLGLKNVVRTAFDSGICCLILCRAITQKKFWGGFTWRHRIKGTCTGRVCLSRPSSMPGRCRSQKLALGNMRLDYFHSILVVFDIPFFYPVTVNRLVLQSLPKKKSFPVLFAPWKSALFLLNITLSKLKICDCPERDMSEFCKEGDLLLRCYQK